MKFTTMSATFLIATSLLVTGHCNLVRADKKTAEMSLTQDQIVNIPDLNLRKALNQALGKDERNKITVAELSSLTSLNLDNKKISSIEGLQYCTNLNILVIGHGEKQEGDWETNTISNLTPLASLPKLKILICGNLHITDFSPLNKLKLEFCDATNHDKSYLGMQYAEIDQTSDTPSGIVFKNPFINMDGTPMPIANIDRKVKNLTYREESLIQFDQVIPTDDLSDLARLALQGYNLVDTFDMSSSGKNSNESLIYGGGSLRVKLRIRSTCEILNQELDDRIARKKTTSKEEFASLVNKITDLREYLSKAQVADFQEKLLELRALLDNKKLDWIWNKEGGIITLKEYIGKAKDVVIPTAKDLGFDGFTVEISSEVLKKAAEDAQTISTSDNGAKIKLKGDSLHNLFASNETIEEVSLNNLDTSNITNMESVFAFCQQLKSIQIGTWNVSNVTNMHDMFWQCTNLSDIDLSKWDTSNVTNMEGLFGCCLQLKNIKIGTWNVSSVINMQEMFTDCVTLKKLDISNWNVEKVKSMRCIFEECENLRYLDLKSWRLSKDTETLQMFRTTRSSPLLVRTKDARLINYDYERDNRVKFGTVQVDGQYGAFTISEFRNGEIYSTTFQCSMNLFDKYTTAEALSDELIAKQLDLAKNNLTLQKKGILFDSWSLNDNLTELLDRAQGNYQAHIINVSLAKVKNSFDFYGIGTPYGEVHFAQLNYREDHTVTLKEGIKTYGGYPVHPYYKNTYASILAKDKEGNILFKKEFKGTDPVPTKEESFTLPDGATLDFYHAEGASHRFKTNDDQNLKQNPSTDYHYVIQNNQLVLQNVVGR